MEALGDPATIDFYDADTTVTSLSSHSAFWRLECGGLSLAWPEMRTTGRRQASLHNPRFEASLANVHGPGESYSSLRYLMPHRRVCPLSF